MDVQVCNIDGYTKKSLTEFNISYSALSLQLEFISLYFAQFFSFRQSIIQSHELPLLSRLPSNL